MLVSILIFLIIFSVIVVGHEFGHYAVARRCGIRVKEFDIGMGPALYKRKGRETTFCLRAFPIGGACLFEDPEETEAPADAAAADPKGEDGTLCEWEKDPHAFRNAGVGPRMATVLAGPAANFIIGLLFAVVTVSFCGTDLPVVGSVQENSAAEEAGLRSGDVIRRIDGESIHLYREVMLDSSMNRGEAMEITYERDGVRSTVVLTPRYDEEDGRYYIGLVGSGEYMECNALQVFQYGFYEAEYWLRATVKSLEMIFRGQFSMDDLAGPVGMVQVVDETYEATRAYGWGVTAVTFLSLTTLLSINLGVMNLLPIPGLDGGRFLLLVAELIRGKKLSTETEGYITLAGVVVLAALMVLVMFNDISRFFR